MVISRNTSSAERTKDRGRASRIALLWLTALLCSLIMGRTALAGNVTLAWDANTETDLAGYKVHYGTSSRTYTQVIDVGNVTTYTVTALATGTYYFAVTAYNTSRAESDYSNEVSTPVGTCTYSLSSNSQSMTARSSAGSVSVIAAPGCAWSASSNASWDGHLTAPKENS